ncbi:hypothetical protein DL96DRAFT_1684826 [Flagelloscypha sp. PMI_526]|nr:hypothetical protein DL96DRAFT_1684826 [Flagelloscypha sp. PMI_526]
MKVFVTGASGFIGSHVVEQLVASGHTVTGLVRSSSAVEKVKALGATPIQGDFTNFELLRQSLSIMVSSANPNGFVKALEQDRAVISTICDVFVGTGKTFINSSGTLGNATADEFQRDNRDGHVKYSSAFKSGSHLNGVAEEGISTKEIAEFIGQKLGLETKSIAPADAEAHWGFLAVILQSGRSITSRYTREWTGWEPKGRSLFEDLEKYTF